MWVFLGGQEGSLGLRQPFYHHEVSVWIERDTKRDRNIMGGRKREERKEGVGEKESEDRRHWRGGREIQSPCGDIARSRERLY